MLTYASLFELQAMYFHRCSVPSQDYEERGGGFDLIQPHTQTHARAYTRTHTYTHAHAAHMVGNCITGMGTTVCGVCDAALFAGSQPDRHSMERPRQGKGVLDCEG